MENNNDDSNGYAKVKTLNEIIGASPYKLSEERERELLSFERNNTPEILYEKIQRFKDAILQAVTGTKNKLVLSMYKVGITLGITSIEEINSKEIDKFEKENSILQSRINSFLAERESIQKKLKELYSLKSDAALYFMDREYRIDECTINLEQLKKEKERIKESMNNGNDEVTRNSLVDIIAEMQSTENALIDAQRDLRRISTKIIMAEEEIRAYENMLSALDIYIDKDEETLCKNEILLSKLKPVCNHYTKPIEVAESTVRCEKMRGGINRATSDANIVLKEITSAIANSKTSMPEEESTTIKKDYERRASDIVNLAKRIIMKSK